MTTKQRAQIIADTLTRLDRENYRMGFNDSVLSICRDSIEAAEPGMGREFWNQMLTGGRVKAFENFLESDQDLLDYFDEVEGKSHGEGCFVMPAWGTKGT